MKKKVVAIIGAVVLVVAITCVAVLIPTLKGGDDSSSETAIEYKVSFDVNGGSYVKTQTVKEGQTVSEPTPPTRKGYVFDCWVLAGVEYDFSTPVTSSFMLTATWFNTENVYRVTTGVARNIGNRGSAEIVGEANTSARFTEGTTVTLKAQANEGYAFNGWVDNITGETISTDNIYTFKVRGDVEIKATFLSVITGTDNPTNKAFLQALENVSTDEGSFTLTQKAVIDGVTNTNTFYLAFNKAQGLAQISVNTQKTEGDSEKTLSGEFWIKKDSEEYFYYIYDGETLTPFEVPEQLLFVGPMIFDQESVDPQVREEVILTVYNMFKDTLTENGKEFSFSTDMTDYLSTAKSILAENGEKTVKQVAYSIMKTAWDEMLGMMNSNDFVGKLELDFNTLTIEGYIEAAVLLGGGTVKDFGPAKEGFKQAYLTAIDALDTLCEFEGKPMDDEYKQGLIDKYSEILGLTMEQFLNTMDDGESYGSINDIPVSSSVAYALVWAGMYNFSLNDTFSAVMRAFNLNGTVWDVQSNVVGTPYLNGTFEIENGIIKSFTGGVTEKDGNAEVSVEYSSQVDLVLPS